MSPQTPHSHSGTECSPQWLQKLTSTTSAQSAAVHSTRFYLANTSRASLFQAGSTGAPLWMSHPHAALMETVSRAEPCTRGSFCRAQAVPLPPLPPSRSRWQSCRLRPPLPVHWPVSLYLRLALDTANFPTIKSGSRIKIRLKLWRVGNGAQPPPAKPLLVLTPQQH